MGNRFQFTKITKVLGGQDSKSKNGPAHENRRKNDIGKKYDQPEPFLQVTAHSNCGDPEQIQNIIRSQVFTEVFSDYII